MYRTLTLLLLSLAGLPPVHAQLNIDYLALVGYPFMLQGNPSHHGTVTGGLQLSYREASGAFQPYIAASLSAMELPLHNRQLNNLSMVVFNTSFRAGLNWDIKNEEENRSIWLAGGGIGLCMIQPHKAAFRLDGQETGLDYTTLRGNAWFPQAALHIRWIHYPKPEQGWYFGLQLLTEGIWLKDDKARYTTVIAGTEYNLNFNNVVLWPSIGAVIGLSI